MWGTYIEEGMLCLTLQHFSLLQSLVMCSPHVHLSARNGTLVNKIKFLRPIPKMWHGAIRLLIST